MDVLTTLADTARLRYRNACDAQIEQAAFEQRLELPWFARSLKHDKLSVIAEVKRASPSKGLICTAFNPLAQGLAYEQAGARAVSVLTEPTQFLGSDSSLAALSKALQIPTLRKDFVVTSYQILEARLLGAAAVLLIVALLTPKSLASYLALAAQLGLDALVEVHDRAELDCALGSGAVLLGVNNRNLRTFSVDLSTSLDLKAHIPDTCTTVSESGICCREHALLLRDAGFDAVLVGEHLMRCNDIPHCMQELMA